MKLCCAVRYTSRMQSIALREIQEAIGAGLQGRGATSHLVARALSCSESTLHRTLRRHGTTFAVERNRIRTEVAIESLKAGTPVASVARRVEVTPDYLRRLIVAEVGMTPVQIARAATLAHDLAKPPRTFSDLSRRREEERRLDDLVGDLPAQHALAGWAKDLLQRTFLPEVETDAFFAELRRQHQRDRAARRDENDLRRLEHGLVDVGPVEPLTPEQEAFERIERAERYATWRRRLQRYRGLRQR